MFTGFLCSKKLQEGQKIDRMAAKAGIRVITEKQIGTVSPDRFGSGKGICNTVRKSDKVKEAGRQEILSGCIMWRKMGVFYITGIYKIQEEELYEEKAD